MPKSLPFASLPVHFLLSHFKFYILVISSNVSFSMTDFCVLPLTVWAHWKTFFLKYLSYISLGIFLCRTPDTCQSGYLTLCKKDNGYEINHLTSQLSSALNQIDFWAVVGTRPALSRTNKTHLANTETLAPDLRPNSVKKVSKKAKNAKNCERHWVGKWVVWMGGTVSSG